MADFVNAVITTDSTALLDTGIDAMNVNLTANGMPNWTPADADTIVIMMGVIAGWMADNAGIAAVVLPAILRAMGTQLYGIPYTQGTYATVDSTWTFNPAAPTGGYIIDAGTAVLIDGQAFYVQSQVNVTSGATTASAVLVANQVGSAYNGLGSIDEIVQPNEQIDWVQSVIIAGPTSGGADQETDDVYDNKLANLLTLQKISVVNAQDFPAALLSDICTQVTGVTVGRATALDGYYPAPRVQSTGGAGTTILTCSVTSGSPTVTINTPLTNEVPHIGATVTGPNIPAATTVLASPAPSPSSFTLSANATATNATDNLTVSQLDGWGPASLTCVASYSSSATTITIGTAPYQGAVPYPGAHVTGPNIPAATTVLASPAPTTTGFSISAATTGSGSSQTLTIDQWQNVGRATTAAVTDTNGNALTAASMDALQAWILTLREANALPNIVGPSYSTVYVSVSIHCLPGSVSPAVAANVQNAVLSYLSPATWGNQGSASTGSNSWLNSGQGFNIVRLNSLIGLVESVPGVQYVPSGGLTLGFSPSPAGVADIQMPGPFPLPMSSAGNIVVTTV